jgi:ActR/RegA family two-component response regulator
MIDDDVRHARTLKRKLATSGIAATLVSSAADILALFKEARFDVALLDIRLSDLHSLCLFEKLKRIETLKKGGTL